MCPTVRIRYVLHSILMNSSDRFLPVSANILASSMSITYRGSGINRKKTNVIQFLTPIHVTQTSHSHTLDLCLCLLNSTASNLFRRRTLVILRDKLQPLGVNEIAQQRREEFL